ncbi:MAG: hypothetical protein JNL62_17260, partial [Bryobacterales bacterium]|nr:hypothetical protein [Bryobacterales bacterium]
MLIALQWQLQALDPTQKIHSFLHEQWGAREGLPEETIAALAITQDGYLWAATMNGLARFDGATAAVLQPGSEGDVAFRSLLASRDGSLWIGSYRGALYHSRPDPFLTLANPRFYLRSQFNGARRPFLASLARDRQGRLLAANRSGMYSIGESDTRIAPRLECAIPAGQADRQKVVHIGSSGTFYVSAPGEGVSSCVSEHWMGLIAPGNDFPDADLLLENRGGGLWMARGPAIWEWPGKKALRKAMELPPEAGVAEVLFEDRHGVLWIGGVGTVCRLAGTNQECRQLSAGQIITAITEDAFGALWLGTNQGNLIRLSQSPFQLTGLSEGLSDVRVHALHRDRTGTLWAGTRNGTLAVVREGRAFHVPFQPATQVQAIADAPFGGVLALSKAGFLHATPNGIRRLPIDVPLHFETQVAMHAAGQEKVYISTGEAVHKLQAPSPRKLSTEIVARLPSVRSMYEDSSGTLWLLSWSNGLAAIHARELRTYHNQPSPSLRWYAMTPVGDDILWLGSNEGLHAFSRKQGKFLGRTRPGSTASVFFICEDAQGMLWLATRTGLVSVPGSSLLRWMQGHAPEPLIQRYGTANGLPTTNFGLATSSPGWQDPDGTIWLASLKGVVRFHPSQLQLRSPVVRITLEQLLVNGEPWNLHQAIAFPAGANTVEFIYAALDLHNPNARQYRYRLEGLDPEWISAGNRRVARYTNLDPGKYRFLVQTAASGESWSGPTLTAELQVTPLFYQTWVFRVA